MNAPVNSNGMVSGEARAVAPPRFARLRRRRVPIVRQLGRLECAAACLAMILRYHGRPTELAECRARCGIGRDGTSTLSLVQAARSFGLVVRSYSAEPDDFARLPLPAIAHWEFDHWIVVERWSPTHVDVVDPARGRRRLRADEFDAGLTGVVLTFAPGARLERAAPRAAPSWISYARAYALTAPGALAQALAASIVLQALGLALPLLSKVLVDRVFHSRIGGVLPLFAIGAALLVATQAVATWLRGALLVHLQARLDERHVPAFFEHLLSLPLRFFEQRSSGDLLLRLASHGVVRDTLTSQTLSLILDGALVAGYLAILLWQDAAFGLLVLSIGAIEGALVVTSARRMGEIARDDVNAQAEAQSYSVEALSGVAALKASGAEAHAGERFLSLFARQIAASSRRGHHAAALDAATSALRLAAPLAMLVLGASRVLDGRMTVGTLLALTALGASFLAPLSSLLQSGQRLPTLATHFERIADVLRAEPEQEAAGAVPAPPLTGRIELRDVGFRYAPDAPWVLRHVSLVIEPGQMVALVGRSGCGKTTLAKLLLGLYPATEGEILYDGIPIERLDRRSLRRKLGVVLQEAFFHAGSIRDNIAFGDRSVPLADVARAAEAAVIDREIEAMPMGYETRLAEGGGGLSGGQRQRLSIARALVRKPAILFLDEATSHLDVATEREVEERLRALACTRIVIAHRLSTIQHADTIVVVDGGTIAEQGAHAELLAQGGVYAGLARG